MARFTVEIDTSNAAFDEDPGAELARILRNIADRLADAVGEGMVRDVNGNTVGTFGWAE